MPLSEPYLWVIAGAACLFLEAFGISGVGFFFADLGAISVGVVIQAGLVGMEAHLAQFAWFFGLTTLWAVVLWKPLRQFSSNRHRQGYSNIIGETAIVAGEGLVKGARGQVSWSGTLMMAELAADDAHDALPQGAQVVITETKGTTLIVKGDGG